MSAKITISFCVPAGHEVGDYAMLYGNGGSGDIDYVSPLLGGRKLDLFPQGAGIYGYGHAPFGHSRFGKGVSLRASDYGFGHLPFGRFPFGHATALITASITISDCGDYLFAFVCFDNLDNASEGTPEEIPVSVHTAPPAPTGLRKVSYDKDAHVLVLEAAA